MAQQQNKSNISQPNQSNVLDLLIKLEKVRNDELIRVQQALLKTQIDYETQKMNLLTQYKEDYLRLEGIRKELRRELRSFPRKTLPSIYAALLEAKLPENLIHAWLDDISKFYLNDVNLSLKMLSTDIGETAKDLFEQVTEFYKKEFINTNQRNSAYIEKILEQQVGKEIKNLLSQQEPKTKI